jgi:hypothetical protein
MAGCLVAVPDDRMIQLNWHVGTPLTAFTVPNCDTRANPTAALRPYSPYPCFAEAKAYNVYTPVPGHLRQNSEILDERRNF